MDVCRCGKERELATIETEVKQLKETDKELKAAILENKNSIKVIENLAVDIALYGQQLVTLTTEMKDIKTAVYDGSKYPPDYARYKRIADNVEHYKKVAIASVIVTIIGAFLIGLKISL